MSIANRRESIHYYAPDIETIEKEMEALNEEEGLFPMLLGIKDKIEDLSQAGR